jgi:ribonucleotide monophosphatase NagD (HAD superfamily)
VATNDDPVFVSGGSGRLQPDVGATLLALEVSSGRKATRVGKPEEFCFEVILSDFFPDVQHKWSDPEFLSQFLMVGDNLETDIWFGKNVGIKTCFLYSGISLYPPN